MPISIRSLPVSAQVMTLCRTIDLHRRNDRGKQCIAKCNCQFFDLFDEIGRGTSTYDGMALAQAIIEYITDHIHAESLVLTHYHELTDMAIHNQSIRNVHVDVHEEDDHITFLYRISDGKADECYGINVARLAHLPDSLLKRANQLLERVSYRIKVWQIFKHHRLSKRKNRLHKAVIERIEAVDINKDAHRWKLCSAYMK